jgi:hypothetical protein
MQRYDKIEIPLIRPLVRQVKRYGCDCPDCGTQIAPVPEQLAPGSPYGTSIAALVTTLRYHHAISYCRMKQLMDETNNDSERALRFSVIFRHVTNGLRSEWGRDLFADIRSIVNTGQRQGLSAFQAISRALDPTKSLFPLG